jgi:putative cell wall-binding protein
MRLKVKMRTKPKKREKLVKKKQTIDKEQKKNLSKRAAEKYSFIGGLTGLKQRLY